MESTSLVGFVFLITMATWCSFTVDETAAGLAPAAEEFSGAAADTAASQGGRTEAEEFGKEVQYLKEKTAELALVAERVRSIASSRLNRPDMRTGHLPRTMNKRHCWDVADVCCMWNIC